MKKTTIYGLCLLIILGFSACSTPSKHETLEISSPASTTIEARNETPQSIRSVANLDSGITFHPKATFDLKDFKGRTYTFFMKNYVKPTLDLLSAKENGGGGGFTNIGAQGFLANAQRLDAKTLKSYKGAKWNREKRTYEGDLSDETVVKVYNTLKNIRPRSSVDTISYFNREDKGWPLKNDMSVAVKEAKVSAAPFDLATLYALTSGLGVKVKIDDYNYNYHVLYKTGKTNPSEEVMSGRSFASSPISKAQDATDPEYLRDLEKYLKSTPDSRAFYKAMILALANNDPSGWKNITAEGQKVLSDFLTVYTAEADRHLMVNLKDGIHPWEIDLAAVTVVSAFSIETGRVVVGGKALELNLGSWFAPSPNNRPGGPQRSGIGITRNDRKLLQKSIQKYELQTSQGKKLIAAIYDIIGNNENRDDVIQGVFEFLSQPKTPDSLGVKAENLADLFSEYIQVIRTDSRKILELIPQS